MSFYLCVSLQGFSIFSPKLSLNVNVVSLSYFMFVYFLVFLQLHVSNKVGLRRKGGSFTMAYVNAMDGSLATCHRAAPVGSGLAWSTH